MGVSPQTIDGASFSRIDMFRSAGVKVVIVLGVTEGVFPGIHSGEGLISDAERLLLRDAGRPRRYISCRRCPRARTL